MEGLGGPIYYFWSMLRVRDADGEARRRSQRARRRGAARGISGDADRGDPSRQVTGGDRDRRARDDDARERWAIGERSIVFAAFGKLTAEKRIGPILRAFSAVVATGLDVQLLLVGDASD